MIPQKKTIIIVFDRESDNAAESRSLLLQIILLKFTGNFIDIQYKKHLNTDYGCKIILLRHFPLLI